METTFSTAMSIKSNYSMRKLHDKFTNQMNLIKSKPVDKAVFSAILGGFSHFPRLMEKYYEDVCEIILEWMDTILYVKSKCDTPELMKMFENILHHMTIFSTKIVDHRNANASFKRQFFNKWAKIISGLSKEIRRKTVQNDTNTMTTLCEAIFSTRHYLTQFYGLHLFIKYIGTCEENLEEILKEIIPFDEFKRMRDMLYAFDYNHFDSESRNFLNELNMKLMVELTVHSVAVKSGFIGNIPIMKPEDKGTELDLWVDFNIENGSVSFFCNSATFDKNSSAPWIYVEILPKRISVDKTKHEFRIYSNVKVALEPPITHKIFSQRKHVFRFICDPENFESLMPVQELNKDIFNATGSSTSSHHRAMTPVQQTDTSSIHSKMPDLQRIDVNIQKEIPEKKQKAHSREDSEDFNKTMNPSNSTPIKSQPGNDSSAIHLNSPGVSSIHSNLNSKTRSETEEIVEPLGPKIGGLTKEGHTESQEILNSRNTSSKEESIVLRTQSQIKEHDPKIGKITKAGNTESQNMLNSNNTSSKKSRVTQTANQINKNDPKIGKLTKAGNTESQNILNSSNTSSKESTVLQTQIQNNKISNYSKRTKKNVVQKIKEHNSDKENVKFTTPEPLRDITNIPNLISKDQTKSRCSPIRNRTPSKKVMDYLSLKKVKNPQSNTQDIVEKEYISSDIQKDPSKETPSPKKQLGKSVPVVKAAPTQVKENNVKLQQVCQKLISCEVNNLPVASCSRALVSTESQLKSLNHGSASKRKLFTANDTSTFEPSQESKDTQIQRRNYIQERRKRESKGSLKLVNLVKPLEFNDNSGEGNNKNFGNKTKFPIAGNNEEQIRNSLEEYSNNRGYIGIKNALNDQSRLSKLTLQERETVNNNLEKINSIVERTTRRFFKTKDEGFPRRPLDVYNIRNAVAEDPKPVNKGKKAKNASAVKKHQVEKFIGENKTATFSYRRNKNTRLGYMEKEINVDMSDSDVTKHVGAKTQSKTVILPKKKVAKPTKQIEKKISARPTRKSLPRAKKPTIFKIDDSDSSEDSAEETPKPITVKVRQETTKTSEYIKEVSVENIEEELTQPFIHESCAQETCSKVEGSQRRKSFIHEVNVVIHNTKTSTIKSENIENIQPNHDVVKSNKVDKPSLGNTGIISTACPARSEASNSNNWILKRYFQSIEVGRGFCGEDPTAQEEERVDYWESASEDKSVSEHGHNGQDAPVSDDHINREEILTQYEDDNVDLDSYISEQQISNYQYEDNESKDQIHLTYTKATETQENLQNQENSLVEDDNVDLDSYNSEQQISNYQNEDNQSEDQIHLTYTKATETQKNFQNQENSLVEVNPRKRKVDNASKAKQMVLYKKIKMQSIDTEFADIERHLILNFKRDVENIFKNIWNDHVKSSSNEVAARMMNILQTFQQQYGQKIEQAEERLKKIDDLSAQIKREEANLLADYHSSHKLLKKLCSDVTEVKNKCYFTNTSTAVNTLTREANVSMKQHWKEYIDKVLKIYVENIKKQNNFDIN